MNTYKQNLILALRKLVRSNFYLFCVYYDPDFFTPDKPHLKDLADALQNVYLKKILKLTISLPPRAGKSYTVSLFCAWLIGLEYDKPDLSIMRNSYGQSLAEKFSYDIRDMISTDRYRNIFPLVLLKSDKSKVSDWAILNSKESTYFCAGVGGAITGKGCKTVAILDDPIKNLEDALSETVLEKTWQWYLSTHKSRLESGCPEIHIATRWSLKDPIGMLLKEQEGQWTSIVVSALDSNGKSFCEKVKTTEEYLELKMILDKFIWEAEFMQSPIEAKGLLYPPSELKYFSIKEVEKYMDEKSGQVCDAIIGYTDIADEGVDYLASGTLAIIEGKNYLIDVVYTQDPIEVTQSLVAQMIIGTNQIKHKLESNNGGKGFGLKIKELIRESGILCNVKWEQQTSNKETRILMGSGIVKEFIYFRNDYAAGSQYDLFMRHLTSYVRLGKNKTDDAADMVTGLAEMIQKGKSMRFLNNKKVA